MKLFYFMHRKWLEHCISMSKQEEEMLRLRDTVSQHRDKYRRKETSKLVLWFMLILLLAIVIFTGYVTIKMMAVAASIGGMMDFTPLVALISAMVGQVLITLGYFAKSTKENSEGGVTYLNAQCQLENNCVYQEQKDE